MKRSKFSEEQIIGVLREQEAGASVAEFCRKHEMSSATFYAWKAKFGEMEVSALEAENAKLKRLYCARGDMENRIKECQLDLFADRTSAATMRANQLRLWFASIAYVLLSALRRIGLAHSHLATATCGTIRLKLLKIGAQVTRSVRRVRIAMASACPYAAEFALAHVRLCR